VLCLPGLVSPNRTYDELGPALATDDRLVIAVSLRGRGRSDRDPTGATYDLDWYVDDVLAVLDLLGLDCPVVIGTSLGGLTAMWTEWRHPGSFAGFALNDVGPELAPSGLDRIRSHAGKQGPVGLWAGAVDAVKAANGDVFPDRDDEEWDRSVRQRWHEWPDGRVEPDHDPAVATGRLSQDDPWAVFTALLDLPVLLVRGALSDLLAPETVELMQAFHPLMELVEVPRQGHSPDLTHPLALAGLHRLLDRVG
jgi:pimeloyl-ACP methyl ester carboxylesterase